MTMRRDFTRRIAIDLRHFCRALRYRNQYRQKRISGDRLTLRNARLVVLSPGVTTKVILQLASVPEVFTSSAIQSC